jgi:hypothetical protein
MTVRFATRVRPKDPSNHRLEILFGNGHGIMLLVVIVTHQSVRIGRIDVASAAMIPGALT